VLPHGSAVRVGELSGGSGTGGDSCVPAAQCAAACGALCQDRGGAGGGELGAEHLARQRPWNTAAAAAVAVCVHSAGREPDQGAGGAPPQPQL
ncbi:hypothetical protein HaLaN_00431, partial [Haematococcus lacustris]